jgi:hypothetical protein
MNMHTKAMLVTLMAGAFTAPVFAQSTGAYSDLWLGTSPQVPTPLAWPTTCSRRATSVGR